MKITTEVKNVTSDDLVVGKKYYVRIISKKFEIKYMGEKKGRCEFELANKKDKEFIGIPGKIVSPLKKDVKDVIWESIGNVKMKITVREVRKWMKRLPENKWRKTYKVDAKRVAYFAKFGEGVELPISLQRVGSYSYNKEKTMAKNYLRSLKEAERLTVKEQKLRKIIHNIIKENL